MRKIFCVLALWLLSATIVWGEQLTVDGGQSTGGVGNPAGVISNFYIFALSASALLAFGMIVWGAIKYTLAAGNPSRQSDAKDNIFQALLGLLLLLGAYIILNTIHPKLVSLSVPTLPQPQTTGNGATTNSKPCGGSCPTGQVCINNLSGGWVCTPTVNTPPF